MEIEVKNEIFLLHLWPLRSFSGKLEIRLYIYKVFHLSDGTIKK